MTTLAEKRYQTILETLQAKGDLHVSELAEALAVSEMTIRRDLKHMEQQGQLVRVHGGAVPAQSARFGDRLTSNAPEKRKAARKLAPFLPSEGTIYLDGSTTMLNLLESMKDCRGLSVATNNIETVHRLSRIPGVEALLIGGRVDRRTDNMVGALALRSLLAVAFDAAFFSCYGLDAKLGPMEMTLEDAEVKDLVASRSRAVYLAVHGDKLGRIVSGTWSPDREKTTLATDHAPDDEEIQAYRNRFATIL